MTERSGGVKLPMEFAGAPDDIGVNQRQHSQLNIVAGTEEKKSG